MKTNLALVLLALTLTTLGEILNHGQISPLSLPLLLIGAIVGARLGWAPWAFWWLGWMLHAAAFSLVFWFFGPGRPAIVTTFWPLLLSGILLFTGLAIWQRSNGLRVAFTMFPWALESTRFVLLDDLATEKAGPFLLVHLARAFIYTGTFVLVVQQRKTRTRWLTLIAATGLYLAIAAIASWPTIGFYALSPTHLPPLSLLAFFPLVIGLGVDGFRARHRLPIGIRATLLVIIALSTLGLLMPWLVGDVPSPSPHAPTAARAPGPRRAMIIDTDLSSDDYVAILYLLQHPGVDIRGITVVNGIVHVEPGLENIHRLLAMTERQDIPVAAGSPTPLAGDNAFPDSWRVTFDFVLRPALPKPEIISPTLTASTLIRQSATDSPSPVSILTLGPLTNVAQALQDDPRLASRLDTIFIAGGAVYVEEPSNPHAISDWNLFVDPYAADTVFRSGAPLALIPLDVTDPHGPGSLLVSDDFVDRFRLTTHSRESRLMGRIMTMQFLLDQTEEIILGDAAAAAIATDPAICTDWRNLSLYIALEPGQVAGKTTVDENALPNTRVCLNGDRAAFERVYLSIAH